mgnify:CR=1 FL=1
MNQRRRQMGHLAGGQSTRLTEFHVCCAGVSGLCGRDTLHFTGNIRADDVLDVVAQY